MIIKTERGEVIFLDQPLHPATITLFRLFDASAEKLISHMTPPVFWKDKEIIDKKRGTGFKCGIRLKNRHIPDRFLLPLRQNKFHTFFFKSIFEEPRLRLII